MGIEHLDIRGLSVEGVAKTMRHVEAVYRDFPQLRGYVTGLGQEITDSNVVMATRPNGDLSGVTLQFHPVLYRDLSLLKKIHAKNLRTGYCVAGTSWEHIGLHEMGHAAEGYLIRRRQPSLAAIERDWTECITASEIVYQAGVRLEGPACNLEGLRRSLSKYAMTSESETLAEAFCDYYANGKRAQPFSRAIVQEVRRRFP